MRIFVCLLLAIAQAHAQTTIDLATQTRNVDFSAAVSTRPFKTGASLPSTCRTGDVFFRTGAATQVLYACTTTNTWTLQSGGGLSLNTSAGFIAQTGAGAIGRSLTVSAGLLITNGDGQAGDPRISADIASQAEAELGLSTNKLMTPDRVTQWWMAANPIPQQTDKTFAALKTNGTTLAFDWHLITPASGVQPLSSATAEIVCDRAFIKVSPSSALTVTNGHVVIADGEDGQRCDIRNTHPSNDLTLTTGGISNLSTDGGATIVVGANGGTARLLFDSTTSVWGKERSGSGGPVLDFRLITPSSGIQSITSTTTQIVCDSAFVKIAPTSPFVLTNGYEVIVDGQDGQRCDIRNSHSTNELTLTTGGLSNLSTDSGATIVIGANGGTARLIFDSTTGLWGKERAGSSNASTATALAANGANCPTGQYAKGVDASGNAEGCAIATNDRDLITPASAIQSITSTTAQIVCDRAFVKVSPTSPFVLTNGHQVIIDGQDGQRCDIRNSHATNDLTLTAGGSSNLSTAAGTTIVIPANGGTARLIFDSTTGLWGKERAGSSNATTATALAANGANCPTGQYAKGVDASGNAEGCATATNDRDLITPASGIQSITSSTAQIVCDRAFVKVAPTSLLTLTNGYEVIVDGQDGQRCDIRNAHASNDLTLTTGGLSNLSTDSGSTIVIGANGGTARLIFDSTTGLWGKERTSGSNATTAMALTTNGTNCPAGQYAKGVDANGNAEGCATPAQASQISWIPASAIGIPAGATYYLSFGASAAFTSTHSARRMPQMISGVVSSWSVFMGTTNASGGEITCVLYDGTTPIPGISVVIPAGVGSGVYSSTGATHLTAGMMVSAGCTNAGSGTTGGMNSMAWLFQY